ncbi:predicted protein [Phaeodactylum tricornutum CCAP 1055/1]|uniref:Vesicle-fusing ATPase n=1 Tax=Phaeodactylum tricornutum (strain CCAP 1055/1) TaxID=556484 RepID=B7FPH3_PHATC|nr:predicted protein [Phaeodactylum tricornutum CCAP 1055/1]EEC51674.1 predicted protein [Phaeodactylum tricornutum CCAP 1055/1]|eukprot:XP_002177211.1 predicted protein [Phaeodactylum tricornutum CCAP 1055/1]
MTGEHKRKGLLPFVIYSQVLLVATAFVRPNVLAGRFPPSTSLISLPSQANVDRGSNISATNQNEEILVKNNKYIEGLLENLTSLLDRWIITGSPKLQTRIGNVLNIIEAEAKEPELIKKAQRNIQRAGLSLERRQPEKSTVDLGKTDEEKRRTEAEQRRQWEADRRSKAVVDQHSSRSVLSSRTTPSPTGENFMKQVDSSLYPQNFAREKIELQKSLEGDNVDNQTETLANDPGKSASAKVSELVALAGAGSSFEGQNLGIGGLDDVLAEVKRRVWTPLAAPPLLLQELGIQPVRGLLLYGKPGCGKTLLARKLGQMLSPLRPITVVSGPEVMDKFVGSSEKNLREVFDNPPDIYDYFRIRESDGGESVERAALHVIVMDEFDAIARSRGGRGGSGDQGDAGVARDSVVNQLLAKMDGVDTLCVPTLVIGLTNKRSLIDPALLRPGRFEVQIEVPPPRTVDQRVSILQVHTRSMHEAGRLLVRDAPIGSAAARQATIDLPSYDELLQMLAAECDGFSGASLAGVSRAAASHSLERAIEVFASHARSGSLLEACVVTREDFSSAINDVLNSVGTDDFKEEASADTEDDTNDNDPDTDEAD